MSEFQEREDAERIEAVMLHDDITELFRTHDPAVLRGKNVIEFISGRTAAPTKIGNSEWHLTISRVVNDSEQMYLMRLVEVLGSLTEAGHAFVYPTRVTDPGENAPSRDLATIQNLRAFLQEMTFDNFEATRLVMEMQPVVDGGIETIEEYGRTFDDDESPDGPSETS